jgi:hypothetical protein
MSRELRRNTISVVETGPSPSGRPRTRRVSSRCAGSVTEAPAARRERPYGDGGNKQGTSNCGTQPPTTSISITCIHARSGQPLAVMLNGTVRGLPYKQEAGGSSPSPPIAKPCKCRISRLDIGPPGTSNSSLTAHSCPHGTPQTGRAGRAFSQRRVAALSVARHALVHP